MGRLVKIAIEGDKIRSGIDINYDNAQDVYEYAYPILIDNIYGTYPNRHSMININTIGNRLNNHQQIAALLQRDSIHTPQPLSLEFCECGHKMPANSCHKCRKCKRSMHAFCGRDHEGEGYGASSICKWCC